MGKLIKTIVLDKTTSKHGVNVDFVTCCNCGKTFLVDCGTEFCPECKEATLTWETDECEVEYDNFSINHKEDYILADTNFIEVEKF